VATARPNQTSRLGVTLQAISPEARNRYRIENNVNGVVVTAVDPTGPAGDKVRPGDVIIEVAQQRVTTPAEVDAKVDAETKAGRTAILLLVNRGGQQSFIGVRVPAAARR
jgi:serine protease Do